MSEDVLIQLLQDINRENVRFGTIEVSFTFHDGRTTSYELTTHRRRNIDTQAQKKRKEVDNGTR